jgi:hypothetical protein
LKELIWNPRGSRGKEGNLLIPRLRITTLG